MPTSDKINPLPTEPDSWANHAFRLIVEDEFLGVFGWTTMDMLSDDYVYIYYVPGEARLTKSLLGELRRRFFNWAYGTEIIAVVDSEVGARFAQFFDLEDTGITTEAGRLYKGVF